MTAMPRTQVRRWPGLPVLVAALTALPALSIDMSLPRLPLFDTDFGVSHASAQLTIGVFLAGFADAFARLRRPLW